MKALVVYYTRTGTTKKAAEAIAKELSCDTEEIIDTKNRKGAIGYVKAGRDAMKKKLTKLKHIRKKPDAYDLVVIGGPVWGWTVCPAVRTYLAENKSRLKKTAYFCTMSGSGAEKTFKEMEAVAGRKPVSTLTLTTKEVAEAKFSKKLKQFIKSIKK